MTTHSNGQHRRIYILTVHGLVRMTKGFCYVVGVGNFAVRNPFSRVLLRSFEFQIAEVSSTIDTLYPTIEYLCFHKHFLLYSNGGHLKVGSSNTCTYTWVGENF